MVNWDNEIEKLKDYVFNRNFLMKRLVEFIIVPVITLRK